jgi:hypothetical protein
MQELGRGAGAAKLADCPDLDAWIGDGWGPDSRADRRVRARSPGQYPSLSVTPSMGITSRPTSDSAPLGQVCWMPMGLVEVLVEAASSDGGHIMLELARDMRQKRTFTPSAAMYEYTASQDGSGAVAGSQPGLPFDQRREGVLITAYRLA